jgi:hypothetical protein
MDMVDFEIAPLKASLQIQIRNQQQPQIVVLKDQHSGKVFQCTLAVLTMLQQIPTRMSAQHFVKSYPLNEQKLLLTILQQAQFHHLFESHAEAAEPTTPNWLQRDWLFIQLFQFDSKWLISLIRPIYQLLFHRAVRWFLLLGAVLAIWQLWQHPPAFWSQFYLFNHYQNWLWVYVLLTFSTICHELGHVYCCHRYGGKVGAIGLALYFGQLVAYADVSDAWLTPNKWHRIKIALAGIYVEASLTLIALWLWLLLPLADQGAQLAFLFLVVTSTRISLNLLPLLRLDGYWVLSDWLEEPNLRSRAAAWSLYLLPRLRKNYLLNFQPRPPMPAVYLWFSVGSMLLVVLSLYSGFQAFVAWFPQSFWWPGLLMCLLILLLSVSLGQFYRTIFQRYFFRRCSEKTKEM